MTTISIFTAAITKRMSEKEKIKHTGATFTPAVLAEYLAESLLEHIQVPGEVKVLDPACGDGELLLAMGYKLAKSGRKFSLTGYDLNDEYLSLAKERSRVFDLKTSEFIVGDFLEAVNLSENQMSLNLYRYEKADKLNEFADVIIANPPYVRTQILGSEKAQKLAKKYKLKGRLDLYYPFLIAMTESLKQGGILGVITSNRYLSTKGGESIRKFLEENYEIIQIIDLGDTKLFDAAVLPAIFIGRKSKKKMLTSVKPKFLKIYEELNGYKGDFEYANSVIDILLRDNFGYFKVGEKKYKKTGGLLRYYGKAGASWEMLSDTEAEWINIIDSRAKYVIGDMFKVRVGIKTTADKIFINDKWHELGEERPEDELLRDLISQENIEPWGLSDKIKLMVLYPHYSENGKKKVINIDDFPKAKKYLYTYVDQLRGRKYLIDAGRQWFEIWVPQNPDLWSKPKLIFPDISLTPRFYFDTGGKIVNGNCYWIVAEKENDIENLLLIQGVANTNLMTRYHDLIFNNKLYSGRRRYFSQYVERYPLPDTSSKSAKEIIRIVRMLNQESEEYTIKQLQKTLESVVSDAFGVPPVFNPD